MARAPDDRLSTHFALAEFLRSATAEKLGIDMTPSDTIIENLSALCEQVLEPLRAALGRAFGRETPITVTSGYRPPKLNAAVGGVAASQHLYGEAADIVVPGHCVLEISRFAAGSPLPYDQCIHEFGRWTHISYARARGAHQRHMSLTIWKDRGGVLHEPLGIQPVPGSRDEDPRT